jgi:hypothetical protein
MAGGETLLASGRGLLAPVAAFVAVCSSMAAAITVDPSSTLEIWRAISETTVVVSRITTWISATWRRISSVDFAVWLESDFTSLATTANPRPASPARAASIVALSASRLV